MSIRNATEADASRIAEILVFNNRVNFWPIFGDAQYSFGELQVVPIAKEFAENKEKRNHTYVFDDGLVKGMLQVSHGEIIKLYVDPFFQSSGIGARLIEFAVGEKDARFLWALEKNTRAIAFYQRHGFAPTDERRLEEGTTEYLVKLIKG